MNQLIHEHFPDGEAAASLSHQAWNCLYTEGLAVKRFGKDKPEQVNQLLARYHEEGLPPNHGLVTAYLLPLAAKHGNQFKFHNNGKRQIIGNKR